MCYEVPVGFWLNLNFVMVHRDYVSRNTDLISKNYIKYVSKQGPTIKNQIETTVCYLSVFLDRCPAFYFLTRVTDGSRREWYQGQKQRLCNSTVSSG
jgi:hypothetical protein